jgi:hypothetical protein
MDTPCTLLDMPVMEIVAKVDGSLPLGGETSPPVTDFFPAAPGTALPENTRIVNVADVIAGQPYLKISQRDPLVKSRQRSPQPPWRR